MGKAFKCDACGEFGEGSPERFRIQDNIQYGLAGVKNADTMSKPELCGACAGEFRYTVEEFLEGDADE